jgi:hypothetical protein
LSVVVGIAGLAARRRAALWALASLAVVPYGPRPKWPKDTVWVTESVYNLVWVLRHDNLVWLVLNDPRYEHTIRDVTNLWSGYYQNDFALGPLLVPARRLLVLGMGAGGSIASTRAIASNLEVDAVEIDPKVVEAGVRFFDLHPEQPWLHVHVADARPWLERSRDKYDLVHVDLYHGGPYVPFYLVTVEFFELTRSRMSDEGLLMMNVYDLSKNHELLFATAATLARVFPSLVVLSRPDGNHILFAFARQRSAAWVRAQLERAPGSEPVRKLAHKAASAVADLEPPAGTPAFTDDHAPVEEMTRRMLQKSRS